MGTMYKRVRENVKNMLVLQYKELGVASIHKIQLGNTFLCSLARSIVFPSDNIRVLFASFLLGRYIKLYNSMK